MVSCNLYFNYSLKQYGRGYRNYTGVLDKHNINPVHCCNAAKQANGFSKTIVIEKSTTS